MGVNVSADATSQKRNRRAKSERYYRPPDVRQKDRFEKGESSVYESNQAYIDKYDYLIVFPLTEGSYLENKEKSSERVKWDTVSLAWFQGVLGTEEAKKAAVKHLSEFWKERVGLYPKSGDEILKSAWNTIAREAIIDVLSSRSNLQLKVTASHTRIFCRIRAPTKLLELQADQENYRLQLRDEIDPGCERFWNMEVPRLNAAKGHTEPVAIEQEEEKVVYSKDEANSILERLYKAGKISPNDLTVDVENETPPTWSKRVHALERIADRVPIYNRFPAFASYTCNPIKRFLFQTYPSVRGRTLFRSKDRLYLTKSVIDKYYDFRVFQERGIVSGFMALHDANRGDRITLDILKRRWVTFWLATALDCGSPTVSSPAYDDDVEAWMYERPFAQPHCDIREYFGEAVALYYAWLGYYTYMLSIPAALGLVVTGLFIFRGYEMAYGEFDWLVIGYVTLVIAWSAVYKQGWDQECQAISLKWGTKGFEEEEKDRPQFLGWVRDPLKRSFVTNRRETYFPEDIRRWYVIGNLVIVFFIIILDLAVFGLIYSAAVYLNTNYPEYVFDGFSWVVAFIVAFTIEVCSYYYIGVATALNDSENHKTQTNYEDALILKTLVFKLVNHFAALIFATFIKANTDLLGSCGDDGCIDDLKQLLWAIFIVRFILNMKEVATPALKQFFRPSSDVETADDETLERNQLKTEPDDDLQFLDECDLDEYEGTFHDYAEAVIQFGYLNLYSVVLPYIGMIALVENLMKIRMDAFKLCTLYQRPHVTIAEDVGGWASLMDMMSVLGLVNTVAIMCFAEYQLVDYSLYEKVIFFLATQQVLMLFKSWVHSLMPSEPDWVGDLQARNNFVVDKYVKGLEDLGGDMEFNAIKGTMEDTVDVEGLGLFDLRKSKQVSEETYNEIERRENKKRSLMRELQGLKDQLQLAYKTESFNDATGIGESKHGLPLGRLSARLVSLKFPPADLALLGKDPQICVRISIKSTRAGQLTAVGPPVGPNSQSKTINPIEGDNPLNQSLGPFAPIRSQDADVIFDILDMRPNMNQSNMGTVSVRLRELQDQEVHDVVKYLKLRTSTGEIKLSQAGLYLTLHFQYSKVAPIRAKIYTVQDKLRVVEKDLFRLRSGKEKEHDPAADIV